MQTKKAIIEKYIVPAFKGRDIRSITIRDLMEWQGRELFQKDENGERKLSDTYSLSFIQRVLRKDRKIFSALVPDKEKPTDFFSVGFVSYVKLMCFFIPIPPFRGAST